MTAGSVQLFIPLAGLVDVAAEKPRLEKAIAEAEALLKRSEGKLANPKFTERAPAEVVATERERVVEYGEKLKKLHAQLAEMM
jgi:valyl-tRNA synthetase